MGFLPENYTPPSASGKYMKLKDGENRFRVLDKAIVGNELWVNHKPVRKPMNEKFTTDELEQADTNEDGSVRRPKHFWAFPVIDMADSTVKILEVTQKGIQDAIAIYDQDADWGDPKNYDLLIKREGSGLETSYSVIAKPAKSLSDVQKKMWNDVTEKGFDLHELFVSGDPFTPASKPQSSLQEINIDDIPF